MAPQSLDTQEFLNQKTSAKRDERLKPARLTPFLKTREIVIAVAEIIRPNAHS
jgi:hypothetical protein